ncbi:MAG: 30S ribosomal protein S20 [Candidatus Omnitrophica bacterium]|nr:30S ribosomal protein S20 [Candidatus Omnitrophota bacterium]
MPRRKTSLKKKRQDEKRRQRNLKIKQRLKKTIKKFAGLIQAKNIPEAKTFLSQVYSQLDKAAKKRIIHPKTASRKKARLAHWLAKATQT